MIPFVTLQVEILYINTYSITSVDDNELKADKTIFATGYSNMRKTAQKIVGDKVANRVDDIWTLTKKVRRGV